MKVLITLLFTGVILSTQPLSGYDASPPCFKQIHLHFFEPLAVAHSLSLFRISQPLWRLIAADLQRASVRVPGLIQAAANAQRPNPLEPPFNSAKAIEILQRALFDVFRSVALSYRFQTSNSRISESSIQGAFNHLWVSQQAQIINCVQ